MVDEDVGDQWAGRCGLRLSMIHRLMVPKLVRQGPQARVANDDDDDARGACVAAVAAAAAVAATGAAKVSKWQLLTASSRRQPQGLVSTLATQ